MKPFFIDTADIPYIRNLWQQLESEVDRKRVVGITTNPSAFHKIEKYSLPEWFDQTRQLCELVTDIRQDDQGVVYIQVPVSTVSPKETIEYAHQVAALSDGHTKVGLKIPPYTYLLEIVPELSKIVDVNVTGIADAGTALKCASYGVRYVSVIPGRMEEVGINAQAHIRFLKQANLRGTEIIAGSMRTLEGLTWTFERGTVPTIGKGVWDLLMLDSKERARIMNIDSYSSSPYYFHSQFCPLVDDRNIGLSEAFFKQMDHCGEMAYKTLA